METTETYSSNNRYWWLMLIIGILSILCGIWVFRNPVESYFALAVYFSIMFILYGIGEIVNAFAGQRYRNWGWGVSKQGATDWTLNDLGTYETLIR